MKRIIRISPPFGGVGGGFYTIFLHGLCKRHAIHTDSRTINQTTLIQFVEDTEDTTGTTALLNAVFLGVGCEFAETRHLAAQGIDILHREVGTSLLGHSQQMEYGIRRTTHGDIKRHRIHKGLASGDITRQDALITILIVGESVLHHLTGSGLEEFDAVGMGSQNGTIARQRETDGLCQRVHRVGREHTRARATTRTRATLNLSHFLVGDTGIGTLHHRRDQVGILAAPATGFHRTTRAEHRRDVQTHRSHQHARRHLVTVGYANHGIGLMGIDHILHRVGNDITAGQRIEHTVVTHGDTIVDGNRIELCRIAAHLLNLLADNLSDLMEMGMTGDELCE